MPKTYTYIRVSTDTQDYAAQRVAIDAYASSRAIIIDEYIEDTVSGTKPWQKRKLGSLDLKKGDVLILNEVSRIGRRLVDVIGFLELMAEKEIQVHIVQLGMMLDASIGSKVITSTLALLAEIERMLISQRTKEGLQAARRRGVVLGRPRTPTKQKILQDNNIEIDKLLKLKVPVSVLLEKYGVSRGTFYTWQKNRNKTLEKEGDKASRVDPGKPVRKSVGVNMALVAELAPKAQQALWNLIGLDDEEIGAREVDDDELDMLVVAGAITIDTGKIEISPEWFNQGDTE